MNVFCVVMFKFNYSVGDIKNSDLGEGIVCLGEGSGGKGEGSGGKGGGKWGKRGREVGIRGEGSGECLPPCPPPLNRSLKVDFRLATFFCGDLIVKYFLRKIKQKRAGLVSSVVVTSTLTLFLLNPDMPSLCKQCRSKSAQWICTVCHSVCEFISTT